MAHPPAERDPVRRDGCGAPPSPRPRRAARARRPRTGPASLPDHLAGPPDVIADPLDQGLGRVETLLVAQALPELDRDVPAGEVALEVQQVRLDVHRLVAEGGVRP